MQHVACALNISYLVNNVKGGLIDTSNMSQGVEIAVRESPQIQNPDSLPLKQWGESSRFYKHASFKKMAFRRKPQLGGR